jgi:fatty aldehyde-generating acyl-ACP reductase
MLVHFREKEDMYRVGGVDFLRRYSVDDDDFEQKLCSFPPVVASQLTFGMDTAICGELVMVMRKAESLFQTNARTDVMEAVDLAVQRGSRVIGLGGLTSPATGGGELVVQHVPSSVTVTNGNAYTAAVVRSNVVDVAEALELDRPARVAIIGCTGSVGVAASWLIADKGLDLILIGRTVERVKERLPGLAGQHRCADSVEASAGADIVVVLTSVSPGSQLLPAHVRPGTVVLDATEPVNIHREAVAEFEAAGVTVLRSGRARIPGYRSSADLGPDVAPPNSYACFAETYLFAREGIREHSVGLPSQAQSEEVERMAARHGVHPRPLELDRIRATREAATTGA